ncbi:MULTISPECIES: hypothetical protein [Bacillus]|uniref:hypothetical protein n=1 Tax=Bacillus TaxID=1386 RepID=UPI00057C1ABD|nr:hypothetical protein [Bacillus sp. MSP13]
MKVLTFLFSERCPTCNKKLKTTKSNALQSIIIKACPNHHYQKECHPALETFIECGQVAKHRKKAND